MAFAASGGSGGQSGGHLPPKIPDDRPRGRDDPDFADRAYCSVCKKYLRAGQSLKDHKERSCVGTRDYYGNYPCQYPGCCASYRHFHDLGNHWKKVHPGAEKPKSMDNYVPYVPDLDLVRLFLLT